MGVDGSLSEEGKVAKLSDDHTPDNGCSALASLRGYAQSLRPAQLLVMTLIHVMIPS